MTHPNSHRDWYTILFGTKRKARRTLAVAAAMLVLIPMAVPPLRDPILSGAKTFALSFLWVTLSFSGLLVGMAAGYLLVVRANTAKARPGAMPGEIVRAHGDHQFSE